jgi:DNA-binding response OmpR family regulator
VETEHPLGNVARRLAATQRVLVVEDEHDIADFLRAYFRASGYDLVHVDPDSAEEVLAAVEEHEPDCVLLDLNLRGFSGADAYQLLQADPRHAYRPVVVVSARPDARSLVAARGGIDAFVTKPFHVKTLAELVMERIDSARRLAAKVGGRSPAGILTQEQIEARLAEAIGTGELDGSTAFALARLRSLHHVRTEVGEAGVTYVQREIERRLPVLLPAGSSVGRMASGELAILLPDTSADDAAATLTDVLQRLDSVRLPGGAQVELELAAGLAACPAHGVDADEVYMAADAALADAVDRRHPLSVAL